MGGSALSDDDRLPWLDSPRPIAKPTPAARRARTPLLVLLGLFCFSAIAVMAYLTGRTTAPVASSAPVASIAPVATTAPARVPASIPAPVQTPLPAPVPAPPIAPPAPVATTPAPSVVAAARAGPAKPRASRPKSRRKASVRRSSAQRATTRPARAVVVHRATDRAPTSPSIGAVPQRRTVWPARPFAGPRGRVIQLAAYPTQAQADAAWWRVARAYPYLATLPRVVAAIGPSRGRPRHYRVRLAAGSSREASVLCQYLHRMGRVCGIV